jgi:hypothetical protein
LLLLLLPIAAATTDPFPPSAAYLTPPTHGDLGGCILASPLCKIDSSTGSNSLPIISFVEYHADIPQSALDVASSVKELAQSNDTENARPVSVLVNNAGIIGKSKQLTMKVNLIGPAMLTLALLSLMSMDSNESSCNNENMEQTRVQVQL